MFQDLPEILTFEEARTVLRIGKNTLLNLLWENEIDGFKIGNRWKIPRTALFRYIHDCR